MRPICADRLGDVNPINFFQIVRLVYNLGRAQGDGDEGKTPDDRASSI
jgi:hypothetical protein